MTEAEIASLSDLNYREALREQSRLSGGTVLEDGGILLAAGAHPNPMMSSAIRTDSSIDPNRVLERATLFFAERKREFTLAPRECEEDRDLIAAAQNAGFKKLVSIPAMILHSRIDERPPPDGIEIRTVSTSNEVADFAEAAVHSWATYGLPPEAPRTLFARGDEFLSPHIPAVVAYQGGEPVASALAILSHGIAGIYWVGTAEQARGRGLGEAVTRAVANISFDRNAGFVSLQASPMGEPIYRRMGFIDVYRYALMVRPSEPPAG